MYDCARLFLSLTPEFTLYGVTTWVIRGKRGGLGMPRFLCREIPTIVIGNQNRLLFIGFLSTSVLLSLRPLPYESGGSDVRRPTVTDFRVASHHEDEHQPRTWLDRTQEGQGGEWESWDGFAVFVRRWFQTYYTDDQGRPGTDYVFRCSLGLLKINFSPRYSSLFLEILFLRLVLAHHFSGGFLPLKLSPTPVDTTPTVYLYTLYWYGSSRSVGDVPRA